MTTYENELLEFLASKQNIEGMILANSKFDSLKKFLVRRFWGKVEEILRSNLASHSDWKVEMDIFNDTKNSKLKIVYNDLNVIRSDQPTAVMFTFELNKEGKAFYGIWINEEVPNINMDGLKVEFEKIRNDHFTNLKGFDDNFPIWNWMNIDMAFYSSDYLALLSTEEYEKYAQEYADEFCSFFKMFIENDDCMSLFKKTL